MAIVWPPRVTVSYVDGNGNLVSESGPAEAPALCWSTAFLSVDLSSAPEDELRQMLEKVRVELYDRERRPKM